MSIETSTETKTNTLKEYYSTLNEELVKDGWITVEESQAVHSWHNVICEVLDAGDSPTFANIAYVLTGRVCTLEDETTPKQYPVSDPITVPDHIPDDINELPHVDGVATNKTLSEMLKREVELCPISAEPTPTPVEINSKG